MLVLVLKREKEREISPFYMLITSFLRKLDAM